LRCIDNLGKASREKLERARALGPFQSIRDAVVRTGLSSQALAALAQAGAFDSFLGEEGDLGRRRKALWRVLREGRIPSQGLDRFGRPEQARVHFEPLSRHELIVQDLIHTGLCTHGHPMETLRADLEARGIRSARALKKVCNGRWVKVAGMVTVRQRPGTAKGFLFLTLEDETGMMNIIVAPQVFDRYRKPLLTLSFLEIHGVAQVEGEGVQIKARHFYPLDGQGARVPSRDFH
jgi:error-prone DNA polymerase